MSPNVSRRLFVVVVVLAWLAAMGLPLSTVDTPVSFDVVALFGFAWLVWFTREQPKAAFFLVAVVAIVALTALSQNRYPALGVAFDGALALTAFEASVLLIAWPRSIPRLTLAGVEHLRAAALRIAIGFLAAVVVVLLGYINLPAVTLMVVVGAIAAAVVLQLSTRR